MISPAPVLSDTTEEETPEHGKSKIEWTDASWNPVTGCTKVSPGCDPDERVHASARR